MDRVRRQRYRFLELGALLGLLALQVAMPVPTEALAQGLTCIGSERPVTTIQVTNFAGDQFDPAVSRGKIAYTDNGSGNADIWVYDIASGAYTQVTAGSGAEKLEDIDGSYVVYTEFVSLGPDPGSYDLGWQTDIYSYDLSTNTRRLVVGAAGDQENPAISGNIVVWEDFRSGISRTWAGDVLGSGARMVYDPADGRSQLAPAISGNLVAWQGGDEDIFAYDLATNTLYNVAVGADRARDPDVSGNTVVYTSSLGASTDSNVYAFNVASSVRLQLTADPSAQRGPKISGTKVVWEDNRSGNTDLYGYDLAVGGADYPVVVDPNSRQFLHDVDGLDVAYTDDKGRFDGSGTGLDVTLLSGRSSITAIAVTPVNPAITVGQTQPFTATATLCDESTMVLGAGAALSFREAMNFGAGKYPTSVAIGDFNGDGRPDLAVASMFNLITGAGSAVILLGDGAGSFLLGGSFPTGNNPSSVASADLNGDGKLDLAVANTYSLNVSILLGDGTGSFGPATNFAVGGLPSFVATGDLNGDGRLDLAVLNSGGVSILLGTGAGSFGSATNFAVGTNSTSVAIGDLNGDGKPDLAVTNAGSNNISILTGDGTGSFGGGMNFNAGTGPYSVAIGDLNRDGKPDLAVANVASSNVSVLLGDGLGSFGPAANFGVGSGPVSVTIGDLNGDGNLDLSVAGNSTVSVLSGTGTGSFGAATHFGVGDFPVSVAMGDLNGDGRPDLAVANNVDDYNQNTVSILVNTSPFVPVFWGSSNPAVATIDVGGLARALSPGTTTITAASGIINGSATLTVMSPNQPNTAPVLAAIGDKTVNEGELLSFTITATDVEQDPLLFSVTGLPPGATFDAAFGTISYTPGYDVSTSAANSFFDVFFEVSDGQGGADNETVRLTVIDVPGCAPVGADGVVQPVDSVTLTFSGVTQAGITCSTTSGTGQPPPSGFKLGNPPVYYELSTTATFSGSVTVCMNYSGISFGNEENLRLFHLENNVPVDVTLPGYPDTANNMICGSVTSLSPFAIFEPEDTTPPVIDLPNPGPMIYACALIIAFGATDSASGVVGVSGTLNGSPVSNGQIVTLMKAGSNTLSVTATDAAGNSSAQTVTFSVTYNFMGFLQPINSDGSSIFKQGSTVPIKYQLTDCHGAAVTTAVGALSVFKVTNDVLGTVEDVTVDSSGSANTGNLFRYSDPIYLYNLGTKPYSQGTYRLQAALDDGTVHTVNVSLRIK